MKRRVAIATLVAAALLAATFGVPPSIAYSVEEPTRLAGARASGYLLRPMSIQFNAKGGGGNAYTNYNLSVVDTTSNNLWTRLVARGSNVGTISLNEMCWSQYQRVVWELAVAGYAYGSSFFVQAAGGLRAECGGKFGAVAMVNGGQVGSPVNSPYVAQSGELRGAVCVKNSFYWSCATHLKPGNTQTTEDQETEYRNIVAFLASGGFQTFAGGDFNINYPSTGLRYVAWTYGNGFVEADSPANTSTNSGGKIDYVFRKWPAVWSLSAYVTTVSWSDHSWLQGYL